MCYEDATFLQPNSLHFLKLAAKHCVFFMEHPSSRGISRFFFSVVPFPVVETIFIMLCFNNLVKKISAIVLSFYFWWYFSMVISELRVSWKVGFCNLHSLCSSQDSWILFSGFKCIYCCDAFILLLFESKTTDSRFKFRVDGWPNKYFGMTQFSAFSCSIFMLFYFVCWLSQPLQSFRFLTGNLLDCERDIMQQAGPGVQYLLPVETLFRPG